MQPAWALPKLLWLLREHADLAPHARLAHQSDLVTGRFVGGPVATDLSNALKTGAHLVDETWPTAVFDALGVPAHVLPPLVRPGTPLGTVCAAAAAETGLPTGTPVVAGATDGCAAQAEGFRLGTPADDGDRFVDELENRGWLPAETARHARSRGGKAR